MASRLSLDTELRTVLGSNYVYFQPPESVKLSYPCIVYGRSGGDTNYSNNKPYTFRVRYTITLIDKNPDSSFVGSLAMAFPTIKYDRHYVADNLNHDVFTLYY